MWPLKSDMSRDECRKCLRCLELDAYGNMVSVLRAQGPLTDEKRKLLGELAKVLHISNERHRAEIRRAVNDEKLSVIAEQLNGPNTCTDWAIAGRRTIPLLPRLKAHTAFTGLANSLSLVIAAANEKKRSTPSRVEEPAVKAETESREDAEQVDRPTTKTPILHSETNAKGKKRKRSSPGSSDIDKYRKSQSTETRAGDTEANLLSSLEERVASLPEIESNELTNIVQVSVVTPSSTVDTTSSSDNALEKPPTDVFEHHKFIIDPMTDRNSEETNLTPNTPISIDPTNRQEIFSDINGQRFVETQSEDEINLTEDKESQGDYAIVKETTQTTEATKISRPDSTTPGKPKRLIATKFCVTTKPIITSSTNCVMTVNSGSTASCGPGPPSVTPSTTVMYKKLPAGKLNHQSGTKMGITLNSSKTLKINAHPSARLASKANVIVVQKGTSRGVTLSHGGKEVLGKVIMGGKNLCLASQKSNAPSLALLPHRGGASNNGDQPLTTLNMNHVESLKLGAKTGNVIMLDIRQDVLDQNKVFSKFLEASEKINSDPKSIQNSNNPRTVILNNHETSKSIVLAASKNALNGSSVESNEKHETSNEDCSSLHLNAGNADSSDTTDSRDLTEMIIEENNKPHGILDAQTGIYNYESADGIIIEERMEESIETSSTDIFSTALDSPDIILENLEYVNDDDDQEIVIESREELTMESPFCETVEEIEESYDS